MSKADRIPIPVRRRLQRFSQRALPPLGFVVTLMFTLWLWQREGGQGHLLGEVEAVQVTVSSPVAGTLAELSHGSWSLFDAIAADEVIARLDDAPLRAALVTLDRERTEVEARVAAAEQEYLLAHLGPQLDRQREIVRLTLELERLRLDVLDRMAQLAVDKVDLEKQEVLLGFNERVRAEGVISAVELVEAERRHDMVQERIRQTTRALEESRSQSLRTRSRLADFSPIADPELESLLAPLRAAIAVQEARIRELAIQLEGLAIRAPISGIVMEVSRRPGQTVQPGDPILLLAADHGRYVVSFVRQAMNWQPTQGDVVRIRERRRAGREAQAIVQRVGPQVVAVPPHQLRDPTSQEWGLPVRLSLPESFEVLPGELVDVYVGLSRRVAERENLVE